MFTVQSAEICTGIYFLELSTPDPFSRFMQVKKYPNCVLERQLHTPTIIQILFRETDHSCVSQVKEVTPVSTEAGCLHIHSHPTETSFLLTESILQHIAVIRHGVQSLTRVQGLSNCCKVFGSFCLPSAKAAERGCGKSKSRERNKAGIVFSWYKQTYQLPLHQTSS